MKRFVSFFLATIMLVTSLSFTASAAEVEPIVMPTELSQENVQPRLYVKDTFTLTTSWETIVTDNNWLNEHIVVKNDADNPGTIKLRVLDEDGIIIIQEREVELGDFISLGPISWLSGDYRLQACTTNSADNGNYSLEIND